MYAQRPLPWLALPLAWLLGVVVRGWVRPPGWPAAALAVVASTLAALYVNLLIAGIRVAGSLGLSLVGALRQSGLPHAAGTGPDGPQRGRPWLVRRWAAGCRVGRQGPPTPH